MRKPKLMLSKSLNLKLLSIPFYTSLLPTTTGRILGQLTHTHIKENKAP